MRRSREGGNLASRPRVDDRQWNETEQNGTELKVLPLLATPGEANQGHNQGRLAHRVRVSGGPKRGHSGLISSAQLGVNEGQTGPNRARVHPPRRSREDGNRASLPLVDPFALWPDR